MAVFSAKVKNLREFQRNLNKLSKNLGNFKQLNKMRVAAMDGFIEENFQKGGALVQSGGWKKLSKRTLAQRRKGKRKASPKILIDNGDLKNHRKQIVGDKEAKIVFDEKYANRHHYGWPKSGKKITPKRPLFSQKAYTKTGKDQKVIQFWFKQQVKMSGQFIRRTVVIFR
jgi:phage gpG-like protein